MSRRNVSPVLGASVVFDRPVLERIRVPVRGKRPAIFVAERLLSLSAEDACEGADEPDVAFTFDLYLGEDDRPIAVVTRRMGSLTPLALVVAVGDDAADLRRQLGAINPAQAEAIDVGELESDDIDHVLAAHARIARHLSRVRRLYASLVSAALGDGHADSRIAA